MWNHAFMFSVTLYHPVRPYKHNFSLALYQQCAYAQAPVVLLMISELQTCKNLAGEEARTCLAIASKHTPYKATAIRAQRKDACS